MKVKRFAALAAALALAVLPASGEARHYSDKAKGYDGWAGAKYMGTTRTVDLGYYDTGDFITTCCTEK